MTLEAALALNRIGSAEFIAARRGPLEGPRLTDHGIPRRFKSGGMVDGPRGSAVPIVAHAGELVIPEPVVRRYASRRGSRGRFEDGGMVTTADRGWGGTQIFINVTAHDTDAAARKLYQVIKDLKDRGQLR